MSVTGLGNGPDSTPACVLLLTSVFGTSICDQAVKPPAVSGHGQRDLDIVDHVVDGEPCGCALQTT